MLLRPNVADSQEGVGQCLGLSINRTEGRQLKQPHHIVLQQVNTSQRDTTLPDK